MSIFDEQISLEPDLYPWTDAFIKSMLESRWTDSEFSFSSDVQDFKVKLSEQERNVIVRSLSAIAQIEISVKTFWAKIGDNLPHPSIKDLGYVMASTEVVHGRAYRRLLKVLGINSVIEENLKLECMQGRVNYLRKYTHKFHSNNRRQFIYSLILFTLFVENVSLFSQFYVVNWFNKQNLLKDTGVQIDYTSKEEDVHAKVGIKIINTIREEFPEYFDKELEDRIAHESIEAFNAESKIIDWILGDFEGNDLLSKDVLKEFIKNRINDSLDAIGFEKPFEIDSELVSKTMWFDERMLSNGQSDFFYARPVEYSKSNKSFNEDDLF